MYKHERLLRARNHDLMSITNFLLWLIIRKLRHDLVLINNFSLWLIIGNIISTEGIVYCFF